MALARMVIAEAIPPRAMHLQGMVDPQGSEDAPVPLLPERLFCSVPGMRF